MENINKSEMQQMWQDGQSRLIDLYKNASPTDMAMQVPACPEWTLHDLLAHRVGVDVDIVSDAVPAKADDNWTQSHIAKRNGMGVTEILNEWQELTPQVLDHFQNGDNASCSTLVADLTIHEQDVCGALKKPCNQSSEAQKFVATMLATKFGEKLDKDGAPAMQIKTDNINMTVGKSQNATSLETTDFELIRMLTGRRSRNQIMKMNWTGDANPIADCLPVVGTMRTDDLVE